MFNGSESQYSLEPGTQDDMDIIQLLRAKQEEDTIEENINDDLGDLVNKDAMDELVKKL